MNILFVVPYVPNLIRVRPYNLIRALTRIGHQVTVLTLWTNEQEQADLAHLEQACYRVQALPMPKWRSLLNCVGVLPSKRPLQSVYSWQPNLVSQWFGNGYNHQPFDVVHVEHLRGVRYALFFKEYTALPVVWDSVDCITHLFRQVVKQSGNTMKRWRSQFDLKRTERYESWLPTQFEQVLVTSSADKDAFVSLCSNPRLPITVLPNGVDLDYFTPDTTVLREPATLVMSGKMSYHANMAMARHLIEDIMPHVWQHRPDVIVNIVGKDPAPEVVAFGQQTAVTVTGTVPDLRPYLRQATIAVSPLTYGAGIQNKVLEAMACGTPVITTEKAVSALALTSGIDVIIADEPQAFAQAILDLLDAPIRRQQLGQAGRHYVEKHHHWTNKAAQLIEVYQRAIQAYPGTENVHNAKT